jgi:hypothetical protein
MTKRSKQSERLKPLLFLSEFRMTWKTSLVAQDMRMIQEKHEEGIDGVLSSGEYFTGGDSYRRKRGTDKQRVRSFE